MPGPALICFDDSEESERAILEAAWLFPGAHATVLHIWSSFQSTRAYRYSVAGVAGAVAERVDELETVGEEMAEQIAERGARLASRAGLDAHALTVEASGDLHEVVGTVAESVDAAVVVVGSRGLGPIQSMALGGFSSHVVHNSCRPVLVVPSVPR
jgi:nucleotide-binding universal stress UspA family protein